jgi:hypothetical protein
MDPDCLLPPPAYSEQEFDQKTAQATTLSLHTSQVLTNIDPDGWPQYDPAIFETTLEGSSTSPTTDNYNHTIQRDIINDLPSVVPLRIEKKSQQNKNLDKPPAVYQPWNGSPSSLDDNPTPVYPGTPNCDDFRSQIHFVQSTEGDMPLTSAMPVHFTQIPNHDRGATLPPTTPPPHFEAQPLAPESSRFARPSVYDNHYVHPYNTTQSQSPRQSLPIQSRPRFVPQGRPMTHYSPSPDNFQSPPVPRLDFNPSIAYGKARPMTPSPPSQQPIKNVQYDPHAFYNSAVSAHLPPTTTGQYGRSYPSYNSPYQQQGSQGSPATYSRPNHYSQSFVSQDALSLERASPPFGVNSSVLQPPARPTSSYSMSSNYQTFNASPSPVYQFVNHTANVPGNIYYDQQSAEHRWSTQ